MQVASRHLEDTTGSGERKKWRMSFFGREKKRGDQGRDGRREQRTCWAVAVVVVVVVASSSSSRSGSLLSYRAVRS